MHLGSANSVAAGGIIQEPCFSAKVGHLASRLKKNQLPSRGQNVSKITSTNSLRSRRSLMSLSGQSDRSSNLLQSLLDASALRRNLFLTVRILKKVSRRRHPGLRTGQQCMWIFMGFLHAYIFSPITTNPHQDLRYRSRVSTTDLHRDRPCT